MPRAAARLRRPPGVGWTPRARHRPRWRGVRRFGTEPLHATEYSSVGAGGRQQASCVPWAAIGGPSTALARYEMADTARAAPAESAVEGHTLPSVAAPTTATAAATSASVTCTAAAAASAPAGTQKECADPGPRRRAGGGRAARPRAMLRTTASTARATAVVIAARATTPARPGRLQHSIGQAGGAVDPVADGDDRERRRGEGEFAVEDVEPSHPHGTPMANTAVVAEAASTFRRWRSGEPRPARADSTSAGSTSVPIRGPTMARTSTIPAMAAYFPATVAPSTIRSARIGHGPMVSHAGLRYQVVATRLPNDAQLVAVRARRAGGDPAAVDEEQGRGLQGVGNEEERPLPGVGVP